VDKFLTSFTRNTQKMYGWVLGDFLKTAPQYVHQITVEHIESYLLSLNCAARTANLRLSVLRSFYNYLEIRYDIPNIARKVRPLSAPPSRQRVLSKAEYLKVLAVTESHVKDCIVFLANSGLRNSEFLTLRPEDITKNFIYVVGKGNKRRAVPINKTIKQILKHNPHLNFLKSDNRVWLWRLCNRAAKLADIPHFSPHSLRHYFATELHRKRVPIDVISKILGHASTTITETVYIHWQDDELVGATDCLD